MFGAIIAQRLINIHRDLRNFRNFRIIEIAGCHLKSPLKRLLSFEIFGIASLTQNRIFPEMSLKVMNATSNEEQDRLH